MALDRVKKGDPISHEWANSLVDAINALQITVSPPLQITKSARGGLVLSIAYGFDLTCVCEALGRPGRRRGRGSENPLG
jgi:hypothetical protein